MTAQPGERTVSWLDEDDPNRGSKPFVPVESVIDLTPAVEEPPRPGKKSRRDKAPKPPKPSRGKLWRREKATQEKPPRESPPRDVTPRAEDWPAPAGDDWLTTRRGRAPRQERASARDTKPHDASTHDGWAAPGGAVPASGADRPAPGQAGPALRGDRSAPGGAGPIYRDEPGGAGQASREAWTAVDDAGPASRDEWPEARDAGRAREWTAGSDEAPRATGPHPAWAAPPERALDGDGWTTPPLASPSPAEAAADPPPREDWFTPHDAPSRDADRPEWNEAAPEWETPPRRDPDARERPDWVTSPEPPARPEWVTVPEEPDRRPQGGTPAGQPEWGDNPRGGWSEGPEEDGRRKGWDSEPDERDHPGGWSRGPDGNGRRDGWDSAPEQRERRVGWGGEERKPRPDWVTSPLPAAPAAAPDGGWSEVEPGDAAVPEAWPAPLDITPDDDLDEPPAKRPRGPRPSGPPTGGRSGGRTGGRPPRPRRRPLMVLAIGLTAVVAAAAVVAAGTIYRLVFDPETPGSHTIAAPLDGRTKGELELATGAETVTVSGADLGADMFQVSTPESGDAIPRATIRGDRTTVTLASNRGEEASAVDIRLNTRVPWRLVFTAGATTQTVDFGAGRLSGLEMAGGATRLELTLPKPAATVPIKLRGGLNELLVHAPKGVLARVKVSKGATNVTLDRFNRTKVAPDTTFTPDGWGQAKARYDIDAAEGIGTVKLDRR